MDDQMRSLAAKHAAAALEALAWISENKPRTRSADELAQIHGAYNGGTTAIRGDAWEIRSRYNRAST
eukprot:6173399-Pleurochrysis_carterae.AAC.3